jgi:hypothetical protein
MLFSTAFHPAVAPTVSHRRGRRRSLHPAVAPTVSRRRGRRRSLLEVSNVIRFLDRFVIQPSLEGFSYICVCVAFVKKKTPSLTCRSGSNGHALRRSGNGSSRLHCQWLAQSMINILEHIIV